METFDLAPPFLHKSGTCPGAIKFLPVRLGLELLRSDKRKFPKFPSEVMALKIADVILIFIFCLITSCLISSSMCYQLRYRSDDITDYPSYSFSSLRQRLRYNFGRHIRDLKEPVRTCGDILSQRVSELCEKCPLKGQILVPKRAAPVRVVDMCCHQPCHNSTIMEKICNCKIRL